MAYKFKVGDKASYRGKQGTIVELDKGSDFIYKVEWSSVRDDYDWFSGRDLDKVTPAPTPDMDVIEPVKKETITTKIQKTMTTIHEQILAELNLEVGNLVQITHRVPSRNLGWRNSWVPEMDKAIGREGIVQKLVDDEGVIVKIDGVEMEMDYYYPAQSIKFISKGPKFKEMKISKDYTAKVYADRIEVGCQTITMDNFEKLQKLVKEVKAN